jgi:hypothetical protein
MLSKLLEPLTGPTGKLSNMRVLCALTVITILFVFLGANILNWTHHIYTITDLSWSLVSLLAACLGLKLAQHFSETSASTDGPDPDRSIKP